MTRNAHLAFVRGLLHDRCCMNGVDCPTRNDHARRTQHQHACKIVDGGVPELLDVLHELAHRTCDLPHRPPLDHPRVLEWAIEFRIEGPAVPVRRNEGE